MDGTFKDDCLYNGTALKPIDSKRIDVLVMR